MSVATYTSMIRVKLPNSSRYHSGPSGDTDYEEAYRNAIFDAKPDGFEVWWPRVNERWPVDSEGYTFVPLRCTNQDLAFAYFQDQYREVRKELESLREKIKAL